MREAIGGTWLFQIVIVFLLLFTGFMCLSINRSKAFSVKDKIIQSIQSHNGINISKGYVDGNEDAFSDIVTYLKENAYRTTGKEPDDGLYYQCYDREGQNKGESSKNKVFCIAEINAAKDAVAEGDSGFDELPEMKYYRVVVFYQLDLPVFHDLFNFRVVGDTKILYGGN